MSTITVEGTSGDGETPLWIAQQDGYFKQQGLTVKVVTGQGASSAFTDLAAHTVQFAQGNYVTLLQAMSKSGGAAGLRVVADNVRPGADTNDLLVAGNSTITSVAQLKGKPIAFPSAGLDTAEISLAQQLKRYGDSPTDYTDVAMPYSSMAGALKSGTISAAFVVQPYITEMEAKGDRKLFDLMSGSFLTFPLEGWMTNTYYTQHDPRTVAAFQRAIVEAQATAAKNPALVRSLVLSHTRGMTAAVVAAMNLRTFSATVTPAQLNGVMDQMRQLGAFPKPLNFTAASLIVPLPSGTGT